MRRERGFALLITITLLAFLVVMLVGLAAYTRVETAIAGNTQRQAQARENALLALQVALGQLQQYAGPDQRVTATAESYVPAPAGEGEASAGVNVQKFRYTGVWDSTTTDKEPLAWLVSGIECGQREDVAVAIPPADRIELVGARTAGTANSVVATAQDIRMAGVPGTSPSTPSRIGRYAWWVGDQGVKAPVAVPERVDEITYPPFDSAELRSRIRQQIALGAGAADENGAPVFEPRDENNAPLVRDEKVAATAQLAFLKTGANANVGLGTVQQNFHAWSPNNHAVLANTKDGGLRQDLSLKPDLLGSAFAAWANYTRYMEDPMQPETPAPLRAYTADPVRRRYLMLPANSEYPIAPVLSFFGLSFSLRNDTNTSSPTQFKVAVRCVAGLWNPYTAAFVPDTNGYQLRVTGLPRVQITDSSSGSSRSVDLQAALSNGGSLRFFLPWTPDNTNDDRSSWLPGRVYNWSALENATDPGAPGNLTQFYERNANQGFGIIRALGPPLPPSPQSAPVYRRCEVSTPTAITIELWRVSDDVKLAEFKSPQFEQFQTSGSVFETDSRLIDFAFIFRLPDVMEIPAGETATWLQAAARDPREPSFPALGEGYIVPRNAPNPALFGGGSHTFDASFPELLLDRYTDSAAQNYTEDVPIFELPRSPILSIGALQHFRIDGARPFSIGNSWSGGVQVNGINASELFDRFFFSGLTSGVTPSNDTDVFLPPNPRLRMLRGSIGTPTTIAELKAAPNAQSSKFLLQGGAFNLNSTSLAAWVAVLRSVRFESGTDFTYLDANAGNGTADDAAKVAAGFSGAAFFRFPQSAQEVYKADAGYQQSVFGGDGPVINTPLYRQGLRVLTAREVAVLATKITEAIKAHHALSGPFRSLEEFLAPMTAGGPSLLEQAIVDAGINLDASGNLIEFSSQFLTQADLMTALAPVLFPRSDTFLVRAYGEAVNPATGAAEGRAWCEALVQRVPEYFDPSDPPETLPAAFATPSDPDDSASAPTLAHQLNKLHGRRFKVVSFRWLTRSDI